MKLLIAGPQGSGKTTQAKLLADHFGLCLVDTGDMIRKISSLDTTEGRRLKKTLSKGSLISNHIAARVVRDRINQKDCQAGYVFDGYPRSLSQLRLFDPEFDQVFYLKIADSIVEDRMKLRARADDTPVLIHKRLQTFHRRTRPVLDYYLSQKKLTEIDGSLPIKTISQQIIQKLKS